MTGASVVEVGLGRLRAASEVLWRGDDRDADFPARIVEAATVLVGGGGVTLGMVPPAGQGMRMVYRGLSDELVERLRGLTGGDAVLDDLADTSTVVPRPRTASLHADKALGQTSRDRVLSAPIRADSGVYAQLYVVDDGGVSGLSADLLAVFATMAGAAATEAQSERRARQRQRWEAAAQRLLAGLLRQAHNDEAAGWRRVRRSRATTQRGSRGFG